jgi:hypothetical protein
MKFALNLATILSMALIAAPASAQRGGSPGGGAGGVGVGGRVGGSLGDGGRLDVSLRGTVDSGRVTSREATPIDRGDAHLARRRWNAANDTGTRIRRPDNDQARRRWNAANDDAHHARRRFNAANGDADARADGSVSASAERRGARPDRNTDDR